MLYQGREKKKSEVATKVPGASPAHLGTRSTGYCSVTGNLSGCKGS
uniref:PRO1828 n=1 Tax=Homo sapiens TaxID=9606 RepID=Q9P1G5_HUMAN|nr:PRO1828 [Homo sapiens]